MTRMELIEENIQLKLMAASLIQERNELRRQLSRPAGDSRHRILGRAVRWFKRMRLAPMPVARSR